MNRILAGVAIVMLAWGAVAGSAASQPSGREKREIANDAAATAKPIVSPLSGDPHTTFVIRFISRAKLGAHKGFDLAYGLDTFEGNRHPTVGCEGSFSDVIEHGSPGQHLAFRERPMTEAGWCPSRYRGTIRLFAIYPCPSHPSTVECNPRAKAFVGRVSWRVRRR